MSDDFELSFQFSKVDSNLGLVFGWAIVCKEGGKEYFDLQGDHIPESAMLEASADFMLKSRDGCDMHDQSKILSDAVVFAFPLTSDIAKAFNIQTEKTGLMIAFRPDDEEVLGKFASGEYTGFSIGGKRISDRVLTDE